MTPSTGSAVLNVNKCTADKNGTGTVLRSGALAIKKGMMSYWDSWGKRHPVTILHVIYPFKYMIYLICSWIMYKLWIHSSVALH